MTDEPKPAEALEALAHLKPPPRWPLALLAIALVVLAIAALGITLRVLQNTEQVRSNRQALRTSCTLLANAILQSGPGGPGRAPTPQQRLNELYIGVIRDRMNAEQKRRERGLLTALVRSGTVVPLPDCEKVATHPGSVTTVGSARGR